jgi:hypothetical protein
VKHLKRQISASCHGTTPLDFTTSWRKNRFILDGQQTNRAAEERELHLAQTQIAFLFAALHGSERCAYWSSQRGYELSGE